ncbi:hypothetical protein [Embleya scabrispora]|uniref:hypothetical protein n=1 Tax=Embleya scabrispora TaxID=159449 RepID=UPI00039EFC36|nr:hypothetical protein [Embleya scabrispora]MYS84077.1 hypothetical protein [Streptomyces sp. SID5474]
MSDSTPPNRLRRATSGPSGSRVRIRNSGQSPVAGVEAGSTRFTPAAPRHTSACSPATWRLCTPTATCFAIGLTLPTSDLGQRDLPDALTLWTGDGSVATIHADGTSRQSGPRRLADELVDVRRDFENASRPGREHHRLRIDPRGRHTASFTPTP